MRVNYKWLLACMLVGAFPLVVTTPASAVLTGYGQVTDPIGDSLAPSTDLVFASISITSTGDAVFQVRYAPGYDPTTTFTQFGLDIDKNPLTGEAWLGMGADAVVGTYGTGFQGTGFYRVYGPPWGPVVPVPAAYLPDGIEVTVPLSALGSSDGLMNFNVGSEIQLTNVLFTPARDLMPDLIPGTMTVSVGVVTPIIPEPSSMLLLSLGLAGLAAIRRRKQGALASELG